jgi:hypothetical protein
MREIDRLEENQYTIPSKARFGRAFQWFCNAFRLSGPFRFVAFVTCLESLFGVETAELTFQLASRAGWLLSPNNAKERERLFDEVKSCYTLRSKIVHGAKYSRDDMARQEEGLLKITREVLLTVLRDKKVRHVFLDATQQECDGFLKQLSLGMH